MDHYPLILLLTAITIFLAMMALIDIVSGSKQNRTLAARTAAPETTGRPASLMTRLDLVLRKTELGRKVGHRIARSGVRIKTSTFLVLMLGASIGAVILVSQVIAPAFGLLSIILVGTLFFSYLSRQEERRREEFTGQLPEVARVLSNATSAGLALPTAVDMAGDELEAPAGPELRRVAESLKVGQSFEAAMKELRERMPSREIGVLVSTLLVAARSGGALVTALRGISAALEERKETRREVKTILGETTTTAWALTVMSISSVFLVNMLMPGVINTMTKSLGGQIVLAISCTLLLIGVFAIRRISKINY